MKHFEFINQTTRFLNFRVIAILCICFFLSTIPALAEWYWVHGSSGKIQDMKVILKPPTPGNKYLWIPVEQGGINSHAKGKSWCPDGYYIVAIDLDRQNIDALDSPVIGEVLCAPNALEPTIEFGWGLDFKMGANVGNWIHFAIPTPQDKNVRYIGLRFWTNTSYAQITSVHLWNGDIKVKEFNQIWSNGVKDIKLDIGSLKNFNRGLGISVGVKSATIDGESHFKFYSVGADFVN